MMILLWGKDLPQTTPMSQLYRKPAPVMAQDLLWHLVGAFRAQAALISWINDMETYRILPPLPSQSPPT